MKKERYERINLEITEFEAEDVIATSGAPSTPPPSETYEGSGVLFE